MTFVCKYVAVYVPDLRTAEAFYRHALGLELLFRESEDEAGTWYTLPDDVDWEAAEARAIEVDMVALRRESLVLALFRGNPVPGTVHELCVGVEPGEAESIRARLRTAAELLESAPGVLRFRDPFGFQWAIQPHDAPFRSSGEIAGRWIG